MKPTFEFQNKHLPADSFYPAVSLRLSSVTPPPPSLSHQVGRTSLRSLRPRRSSRESTFALLLLCVVRGISCCARLLYWRLAAIFARWAVRRSLRNPQQGPASRMQPLESWFRWILRDRGALAPRGFGLFRGVGKFLSNLLTPRIFWSGKGQAGWATPQTPHR